MKDMAGVLTLDKKGLVLAFVFGILIFFFGQSQGLRYGILFLGDILAFLVLSAIVTEAGKRAKEGIGMYESLRGWKNVASNGSIPLLIAFFYFLNSSYGFVPQIEWIVAMVYVASVASVTADKIAHEIGVLDGEPVMLLTLKKVKKGTSGAVTLLGMGTGLVGSLIIGASVLLVHGSIGLVAIIAVSGFFGNLVDSVLGYYEEKGIGNKHTSNFMCAVSGALACALMLIY